MKEKLKQLSFLFTILFFGVVLSGTKACQEDYFFATQTTGVTDPDANDGDGTPTATPTVTRTGTTTPTPTPSRTATTAPTTSVVPTATVGPTVSVVPTATVKTAALVSGFSFKSDLPDATKEDLADKEKKTEETNNSSSVSGAETETVKPSNWLGTAFSKEGKFIDSDGDGFADEYELAKGSNPKNRNSVPDISSLGKFDDRVFRNDVDKDGCTDTIETGSNRDPLTANEDISDSDGDCLSDEFETANNLGQAKADSDGDGLDDGAEVGYGTNPYVKDTDGDGISDGVEVREGKDPLVKG